MTRRTWLGSPLAALGLPREATSLKSTELEDRKRGPKPTTEGMQTKRNPPVEGAAAGPTRMNLKARHAWGRMFNARSRTSGDFYE